MKNCLTALVFVFICVAVVGAEYARNSCNEKDYNFKDSDLKQTKSRWISLQEEDWGDDMMQDPIDELQKKVSSKKIVTGFNFSSGSNLSYHDSTNSSSLFLVCHLKIDQID